jgi:hypothetical protein
MKREPKGRPDIVAAIERLAAKGKTPTQAAVRGELLRTRHVGASFETILPVLREWKRAALDRASGRIEAAVDGILALRTRAERDEVRRLVLMRSAGGIGVRFKTRRVPRRKAAAGDTTAAG